MSARETEVHIDVCTPIRIGTPYAGEMSVRSDCRHYSSRSTPAGSVERCRLDMAQSVPFDCPDNCIFFEKRAISGVGWQVEDDENGE